MNCRIVYSRCFSPHVLMVVIPLLCGSTCGFRAPGTICTAIAVSSLTLDIQDAAGHPLPNATIDYQINLNPPQTATCSADCANFVVAYEQIGHFQYTVSASGYASASGSADIAQDAAGCHPIPQRQTVVMR